MANIGFSKPKKSQLVNAGATTFGAVVGYEAYEKTAQHFPITKEINLGILGGSVVGQAVLTGRGIMRVIASGLLLGITLNAAITAAEDYGVIKRFGAPRVATAKELNGLYGEEVEYIDGAIRPVNDFTLYNLSGVEEVASLM